MTDTWTEASELLSGEDAAHSNPSQGEGSSSSRGRDPRGLCVGRAGKVVIAVALPLALVGTLLAVVAREPASGHGSASHRQVGDAARAVSAAEYGTDSTYGTYAATGPFSCMDPAPAPGQGDTQQWRCLGGACILAASRCDGNFDCMDQSDESDCQMPSEVTGVAPSPTTYTDTVPSAVVQPDPVPAPMPQPQGALAPAPPGSSSSNSISFPLASSWQPTPPAEPSSPAADCFEHGGYSYQEVWRAQGPTFFDSFNYLLNDANSGAAQYLTKEEAMQKQVTVAYNNHAIIRAGPKGRTLKRTSAKLETKSKWKYFLMVAKFTHVPWGCGVWPAFWTHSPEAAWPNGGELDILEYSNEIATRSSFHCGLANKCKLDQNLLRKPGCPQYIDAEFNFTGDYQCVTHYPDMIGCAPNRLPLKNGEDLSMQPFVAAAEWTPEYVKLFRIPASEAPADLESGQPNPDGWDRWLTSYYPFAASERNSPGSCPNPGDVMKAQQLVLSLGFCGDWSSKVWLNSTCANNKGPQIPTGCVAVDPHNPMGEIPGGPRDCCTAFITDPDSMYGADEYLSQRAYFNVSYLKVFQHSGRRLRERDGLFP